MGKYGKKDAGKDTGSSSKDVSKAWHDARDDSGAREGGDKDHFESPPDWADESTDSGIPLFPNR